MDLSRAVYNRDLKIAAMRALDAGSATGEIARKYQLSPNLLTRWRGEWRAKGESAFPGVGRRGAAPATPRFNAVAPEWLVTNGAADAAPAVPAAESTLGSHPCVALSSAQPGMAPSAKSRDTETLR